jgi:hypothetical protein
MQKEPILIIIILILAISTALSPWLMNNAPYIGDAWLHLRKAEDIVIQGRLKLEEYNDMWPLVNLLLVFYSTILGLSPLISTQMIPFLVSLSTINLYIISSKISRNIYAAFSTPIALIFTPLYTFITFGSAVMKETAAFYLTTLLITYFLVSRPNLICFLLLSFGLVVGHHFASLAVFILLLSILIEDFSDLLNGDTCHLRRDIVMVSIFGALLLSWNFFVFSKIGWFLPISSNSLLMIIFTWFGIYIISRIGRFSSVAFQAFLIPLTALAWRGYLHDIPTPVNPISIWEVRDLIIFIIPALIGLALFWRNRIIRSILVSTTTLIAFSLISGLDYNGLVVFTKSLHYYSVFWALMFGLSWPSILNKRFGKMLFTVVSIYLVLASVTGIGLALNGPGAYNEVEYEQLQGLRDKLHEPLIMDVKLSYLSKYLNVENSIFHNLKQGEYVLLTKSNFIYGILLGYVWVDLSLYMPHHLIVSCDRLVDGGYIKILRINNV